MAEPLSFPARLDQLVDERGGQKAITFEDDHVTFDELNRRARRLGRYLQQLGVVDGDMVSIAEPNGINWFVAFAACWHIGAIPQPVSSRLPAGELDAIVEVADAKVVLGANVAGRTCCDVGFVPPDDISDGPLPDVVSPAWKAPTSGGSTGRPKLIVSGDPARYSDNLANLGAAIGAAAGETMVMPGPLYHNGPLIWSWSSLLAGGHVALLGRFDAESTLSAIDRYGATAVYLVPTMMARIWKLPDDVKFAYDMSTLRRAFHLAAPCPKWLKKAWIDWIGADALWELYGGTEGQSFTILDGNEWLAHEGSVGTPISGEMQIRNEDGEPLGPNEVGEVWMRPVGRDTPTYRYLGAEAETVDGWDCLGDIGWMDADGYLYLADRRSDMILVGGANVFPAEVESAIDTHPAVESSAVIGLPHDELGNVPHAVVHLRDGAELDEQQLLAHVGERLVRYKVPRSAEFVDEPLRDDAGKVRRSALRAERVSESVIE